MPSVTAIGTMAAAAGGGVFGGLAGWRKSGREGMDSEDRAGFTASSIVAGTAAGYGLNKIGLRRLGQMGKGMYGGARLASKAAMANPVRSLLNRADATSIGKKALDITGIGRKSVAFKGAGGSMAAIAMAAIGVGAIAYGARSNPKTNAYASPDGSGGTDYNTQSVKERMGLMGATGDMVFGLNNARHG